jgi:ribosome biogenesis protein UTP30
VIVKDPGDDFKAKLAAAPVPGFTKVISVGSLRRKYSQFKERAALLASYDAFFADDRVVRMMPQVLGAIFTRAKKLPIPVNIAQKGNGWSVALAAARDATYLYPGWGQTTSVRIGRASMAPAQVAANIMAAMEPIVREIPKKWRGIQTIYLTSPGSVSLPLFKALANPTVDVDIDSGEEEEEGEEAAAVALAGKKRRAPDADDEDLAGLSDVEELLEGSEEEEEDEESDSSGDEEIAEELAKSDARVGLREGGPGAAAVNSSKSRRQGGAAPPPAKQVRAPKPAKPASLLSRKGSQMAAEASGHRPAAAPLAVAPAGKTGSKAPAAAAAPAASKAPTTAAAPAASKAPAAAPGSAASSAGAGAAPAASKAPAAAAAPAASKAPAAKPAISKAPAAAPAASKVPASVPAASKVPVAAPVASKTDKVARKKA